MSALGSEADMCVAKSDVRFTPNSDHKSGFPHKVSALPLKADTGSLSKIKCAVGSHALNCRPPWPVSKLVQSRDAVDFISCVSQSFGKRDAFLGRVLTHLKDMLLV
jgi:hypothetical protein